jgi:hypothetical protein
MEIGRVAERVCAFLAHQLVDAPPICAASKFLTAAK